MGGIPVEFILALPGTIAVVVIHFMILNRATQDSKFSILIQVYKLLAKAYFILLFNALKKI
jgi:lysophospholipase L1-like esterase